MATKKIFVFSLMTMLVTLLALYINTNRPITNANMNLITLNDDVWIGIALFINYLLIVCFYAPKPSLFLRSYKPKSSRNQI